MDKRKLRLLSFFIICCAAGLWLINRDLFRFSFTYPYAREFVSPAADKGYSQVLESLTLKPGTYEVRYKGETSGKLNGYSIRDRNGEVLKEGLFEEGRIDREIRLDITGSSQQVQFGILFEGDDSSLRIDQIEIHSEHVLYKDSLLRHTVVSCFFVIVLILVFIRAVYPEYWNQKAPRWIRGENERVLLFLTAVSLFSCYPLMVSDGYILADDMQYHLARIEGIAQSWRAGIFPARIHLFVIQNYGYGNGFFYPQLWLTIPALLRLLGFSVLTAYNIFVVLCTFLSVLTVFLCTKHIGGNLYGALGGSSLFCFAAYRLIDIYYRGALGEIQSFIFIPLIVYALYDMLSLDKDNWLLLAFGFFGLLSSHIISFTIVCIVMLVFVCVSLVFTQKRLRYLLFLGKAAVLTSLLGSYFLIPMAEQWKKTSIVVNTLLSNAPGGIMETRMLPWKDLFCYFEPWNSKTPWPGICFVMIILGAVFCLGKKKTEVKTAHILGVVSVLCLWISTDLFPWQIPLFSWLFTRIQFTWRFLLIFSVCFSVAGGLYLPAVFQKISLKFGLFCVMVCALLCAEPILNEAITNRYVQTPQFILQQNRIGGGEYLPRRLNIESVDKNRDTVLFNGVPIEIRDHDRQGLRFRFSYDVPDIHENDVFDVPVAFYTGYQGRFISEDGKIEPIVVFQGDIGLASVKNITADHGTIEVWYAKTGLQKISEIISLLTLCGCMVITTSVTRRKHLLNGEIRNETN